MTVSEIARLTARPGRGDDLALQLERSLAIVLADPGCVGARLFRGIEDPNVLVCEIEWLSVEAHHAWRDSPGLAAYRAIIGDLEGAPIDFAHYTLLTHQPGAATKPR